MDTKSINREIVNYYQSLLRVSNARISIKVDIVNSGKLVSDEQANLLVSDISTREIKQALDNIGNEKAPWVDGFNSFFFKKCWDIVGTYFCNAVQQFF